MAFRGGDELHGRHSLDDVRADASLRGRIEGFGNGPEPPPLPEGESFWDLFIGVGDAIGSELESSLNTWVEDSPGLGHVLEAFGLTSEAEVFTTSGAESDVLTDRVGPYRITADEVPVRPGASHGQPCTAKLNRDAVVDVIRLDSGPTLIWARIKYPAGWISVANVANGHRWADPYDSCYALASGDDLDDHLMTPLSPSAQSFEPESDLSLDPESKDLSGVDTIVPHMPDCLPMLSEDGGGNGDCLVATGPKASAGGDNECLVSTEPKPDAGDASTPDTRTGSRSPSSSSSVAASNRSNPSVDMDLISWGDFTSCVVPDAPDAEDGGMGGASIGSGARLPPSALAVVEEGDEDGEWMASPSRAPAPPPLPVYGDAKDLLVGAGGYADVPSVNNKKFSFVQVPRGVSIFDPLSSKNGF